MEERLRLLSRVAFIDRVGMRWKSSDLISRFEGRQLKAFCAFASFLVMTIDVSIATTMDYYEHVCWEPSSIDGIHLGFKNEWGQTRALTFEVDDKVLLIKTREMRGVLYWKYLKRIHLRTRGDNKTLVSMEIGKQGSTETRMLEGGYVSNDCLRRLVAKVGAEINFIRFKD